METCRDGSTLDTVIFPLFHRYLSIAVVLLLLLFALACGGGGGKEAFGGITSPAGNAIIIDNDSAGTSSVGTWSLATGASEHYGTLSMYATVGGGIDSYRFTPNIVTAGNYEVHVWNSCYSNRATNVPHRIVYDGGETTVEVDQDCDTGSHGEWLYLGTFHFQTGTGGYVEISDSGLVYPSTTYIGADAVCFVNTDTTVNQPPAISGAPATSVTVDQLYSFTPQASDPDGDTLTFSVMNAPAWSSFDSSAGTLSGTPGIGDLNTFLNITISVSDGQAIISLASFDITVEAVPSSNDIIIDNNEAGTLSAGTWNSATGASEHYETLSVYATVGGGTDSYRFTPTIVTTGYYEVYAWNSCYSNRATNVPHRIVYDGGETTVEVDQDCDTGPHGEWSYLGTFHFQAGTGGYVEISDSGLVYPSTTYIGADAMRFVNTNTPAPANQPPVISGTPATSVTTDQLYSFTPQASDPDGDTLIFSVINAPVWSTFDSTTGTLSWAYGTAISGEYPSITISVSDGQTTTNLTPFTVTVTGAPAVVAIDGFTNVTQALDATGTGTRYDVGGGNYFAMELSQVPWQSLQPGDVVNIYYRTTPYRHKVLLSEQGTAVNPIVVNGVTSASGERPTIDAQDAVSVNPEEWNSDFESALIMINKRNTTGTYGENAKYYLIQGLHLTGVRSTNSYTHNGVVTNYPDAGRAIWSAGGQYVTLQGMVIDNCGSGVFIQAADDPGALSKAWTIRGSKFENNGSGDRDHQIYFQAVSDPGEYNIVEGNYFGPPTVGQLVAQLKVRATGAIIRYNWFNSSARTIDLVEAQDAIPAWMYDHYTNQEILDYYRTSYIYGNVFVNDFNATSGSASVRPLHFGADSLDASALFGSYGGAGLSAGEPAMRGYQSPTYFYHNTFYMRANSSDLWRGNLFDLENNNSLVTPTPGEVDAWNNIIEFAGNTRIGTLNRSGTLRWNGINLVHTATLTIFAESDAYASNENPGDDSDINIINNGNIINGSANFVDATNIVLSAKDFSLNPGSPAIGQAVALPAELVAFPVLLQPSGLNGGAIIRSSTVDLGAISNTSP